MKKGLIFVFPSAIFAFIVLNLIASDNESIKKATAHQGYSRNCSIHEELLTIDEIDDDCKKPGDGKNIFFHETSASGKGGAVLNARQACAIESAAKMNPNMTVYLLLVGAEKFANASKGIVRQLASYDNIEIRHILMERYIKGTPLEEWWATDILKKSRWPSSHMSDILRYLTLWKYGGIYLDLDVVVTSNLEGLTNFAGAEDSRAVAAGVMSFGATGLGRKMANDCLNDLKTNFRGDVWGNNGPGVITRTLQKLCATKYARDMTKTRCRGFTVYPPSAFYPIHYKKWKRYFETKNNKATLKMVEKSLAIHVWNKLSRNKNVIVGSQVPYGLIAQKYCPRVYSHCGTNF